jgi:ABC-type branched-subunit amino acid transport system ATPase component
MLLLLVSFSLLLLSVSPHLSNIIFYIGQTGLGKSTLINTIFASHLIDSKGRLASEEAVRKTTEIQAASHGMFCSCQSNKNENEFSVVGLVFYASFFTCQAPCLCFGTSFFESLGG